MVLPASYDSPIPIWFILVSFSHLYHRHMLEVTEVVWYGQWVGKSRGRYLGWVDGLVGGA